MQGIKPIQPIYSIGIFWSFEEILIETQMNALNPVFVKNVSFNINDVDK